MTRHGGSSWRSAGSAGFLALVLALTASCAGVGASLSRVGTDLAVDTVAVPGRPGAVTADIWRTAPGPGGPGRPVLLLAHGGGWATGDRSELDDVARTAAEEGFVAVNVDYDLSRPGAAQVADLLGALQLVRADPGRFGADPRRVGALGSSAGATLAVLAGQAPGSPIGAVVGWSGAYDFQVAGDARYSAALVATGSAFVGCDLYDPRCRDTSGVAASPTSQVGPASPPVFLVNSTDELVPVQQVDLMQAAMVRAGRPVAVRVLPGSRHASQYSGDALDASLDFLRVRLDT